MTDRVEFYTETLAGIYASQGHLDKAIEIYTYLSEKSPGSEAIKDALADVERKRALGVAEKGEALPDQVTDDDKLEKLFGEWIQLVLRYDRIRTLKKLRSRLNLARQIHAS